MTRHVFFVTQHYGVAEALVLYCHQGSDMVLEIPAGNHETTLNLVRMHGTFAMQPDKVHTFVQRALVNAAIAVETNKVTAVPQLQDNPIAGATLKDIDVGFSVHRVGKNAEGETLEAVVLGKDLMLKDIRFPENPSMRVITTMNPRTMVDLLMEGDTSTGRHNSPAWRHLRAMFEFLNTLNTKKD